MNKKDIEQYIDANAKRITDVSDAIWDYAELAFHETRSAAELQRVLREEGFEVHTNLAGIPTAFEGVYGSGKPVVAILGEFDALAGLSQEAGVMEEQPVITGGNGHGCGHNLFGGGSLGAAMGAKKYLEENGLKGTLKFIGTPAEEGGGGKTFMARDGVFDDVDIAICWHPSDTFKIWSFKLLANVQVTFKFKGIPAHAGSRPHLGRSALDALELTNMGIQFLREHVTPDIRMHYAILDAGGTAPNVVQARASERVLLRAENADDLTPLLERVTNVARGAALMTDTQLEVEFNTGNSNIILNDTVALQLEKNMDEVPLPTYTDEEWAYAKEFKEKAIGTGFDSLKAIEANGDPKVNAIIEQGRNHVIHDFYLPYSPMKNALPGSSDVGDVSWVCPTAQVSGACQIATTGSHTWQAVSQGKGSIAHKGMLFVAKVMGRAAVDFFEDPTLVEQAWKEHRKNLGGRTYVCPIPKGVNPVK